MGRKSKKAEEVKVKSNPKLFTKWFRAHRILHGGKEVVEILTAYKKVYKLIAWDLVPVANQFLLVVELEPKPNTASIEKYIKSHTGSSDKKK